MENLKKEIEEKLAVYNEINKQQNDLDKKHREIGEEISTLKFRYLLETKALGKIQWTTRESWGNLSLHVKLSEKLSSPEIALLFNWYETNYHCQSKLTEKTTIRFDDGELTLRFEDSDEMVSFCKEHEIKVDTTTIKNTIIRCQDDIKSKNESIAACQDVLNFLTAINEDT